MSTAYSLAGTARQGVGDIWERGGGGGGGGGGERRAPVHTAVIGSKREWPSLTVFKLSVIFVMDCMLLLAEEEGLQIIGMHEEMFKRFPYWGLRVVDSFLTYCSLWSSICCRLHWHPFVNCPMNPGLRPLLLTEIAVRHQKVPWDAC